jgi:hydroxymethylpyrimidine kinase/phosphomethylpyrimidine kinase
MSVESNRKALTIAGFDPSGGAGVLVDAKTFATFGLEPAAVITSLTFQNSTRVLGAAHQTAETVRAQLMPIMDEYEILCAKVGMLPTREIVVETARLFRETDLPSPVVDPVMVSTSGQRLIEDDALDSLFTQLFPLARLITPNVPEAERITGMTIASESEMRQAATLIRGMGVRAVLIKGGHMAAPAAEGSSQQTENGKGLQWTASREQVIDLLDDNGQVTIFREDRIPNAELHGSGCIMSAAIAAGLGRGMTLEDSVSGAKTFVWEAIRNAATGAS